MKKNYYLIFLSVLILSFYSCKKNDNNTPGISDSELSKMQVSENFDWKTSHDVSFKLSNLAVGVVKISSSDGHIYYKAYNYTQSETFLCTINLPYYIDKIAINTEIVDVTGDQVIHGMKSTKSSANGEYSLQFDGNDNRVIIESSPLLTGLDNITIEAWVKLDELGNNYRYVVYKNSQYGIKLNPSGSAYKPGGYIYLDGNWQSVTVDWADRIRETGIWYHLAMTYDGSEMKFYLNGDLKKTKSASGSILEINNKLSLGANLDGDHTVNGNLDEIRIWNSARNFQQINASMETTLSGNEEGLVAYYNCNQGSGDVLTDNSGHDNNGEIIGTQWSTDIPFANNDTDGDGVPDISDDYPYDNTRAFNNFFPATGFGSLAFEDQWPSNGDYDFNDLIVDYRYKTVTSAENKLVETFSNFAVRAYGAGLHNGFGFQLPNNNLTNNINVSGYNLNHFYIDLDEDGTEATQNKPTIIVFDDSYDILTYPGAGVGVNTTPGATYVEPDTLIILMTYTQNEFTIDDLNISNFNPFLIIDQLRGKEVHLADYAPTALADDSYFGTIHDASNPELGIYYKTENNLPWVINIAESYAYTNEKTEITQGYNYFVTWAESSGNLYSDWYLDLQSYRNESNIFQIPE